MGARGDRLFTWLDERVGLVAILGHIRSKTVPLHRYSALYLLGGITLFLFGIQAVTGVLLMLYYRPSVEEAHASIELIMTEVRYGWLVRSVHGWSSHLLVFFAFLHMATVFFARSYRKPRELTWVSGCLLFFLILGFGFSGYLLPWTQLAFFATKVGTEMARWMPVAGEWVSRLLVGGERVGGATLSRFYTLHVFVLPFLSLGLVGFHLYLVQRHGMSVPPAVARSARPAREVRFFPVFFYRDLLCWLVVLAAVVFLAGQYPTGIGEKADPFAPAYEDIRPEWYFVFLFQSLRMAPSGEIGGVPFEAVLFLLLHVGGLALFLVPFLDRGLPGGPRRAGHGTTAAGMVVLAYVVVMTALGYRSPFPLVVVAATLAALWLTFVIAGATGRGPRE